MTLEEHMEKYRQRIANMTLAQARDLVAKTISHSDMEIEFDKAVKMLLDCADEAIQNKVPDKVQQAYEDGKKDGYMARKIDEIKAESLIDKIRAELTEKRDILAEEAKENMIHPLSCYGLDYALLIIDKYKAESEG